MFFMASYVALWLVVLVHTMIMIGMFREHVALMERVGHGGKRLHGPTEGWRVPPIVGLGLQAGAPRTQHEAGTIVGFMSVGCQPCWGRREAISEFAKESAGAVRTIVVCAGQQSEVRRFAETLDRRVRIIGDVNGATTNDWRISMTPVAVAVDEASRASGTINNPSYVDLTALAARLREFQG